jgi:undecaprenyl-diphosphatase
LVSRFYFDPRPFVQGNFTPLLPHAADNGFPSDHTLLAAAIAFATFHFNKKLGLFLLLLAILVGVARILAGVHHVADIAGSIIITGLVYFLAVYSIRKKE